GQSVLILREGSDVPENEADQLANLLAASHVPYVMLQVLRRYQPPTLGGRSIFLSEQLSMAETERFRVALELDMPSRAQQIAGLATSASTRTPFLFGLAAFASDF